MVAMLTGGLLAASAGLNAYIPLLIVGLLARFSGVVELPEGWQWIGHDAALITLGALFLIDIIVDKVPALDSLGDVVGTVVRPASGGLVFAAGSGSQTIAITDPQQPFGSGSWWPILIGIGIALVPHLIKALGRPVLNAFTGGAAAPVMSTIEDVLAVVVSVLAVVVPLLALALLVISLLLIIRRIRKARRLKRDPGLSTV